MVLYVGADHGGFQLKETIITDLNAKGYEVVDCGNTTLDPADDYPDFARAVAEQVSRDPDRSRGILICRSGVGVDIVANKHKNVRSFVAMSNDQVYAARHDDNVNVLSIGSDYADHDAIAGWLKIFLETPFGDAERYQRRLDKIAALEHD